MKYFTEHGGYAQALDCMQLIGGSLFPRRRKDGTTTLVCGKQTYTFWEPNSKSYAKCKLLAEEMNFPHEHFTPGRVSKHILKEICGLKPDDSPPDKRMLQLARSGHHWHYLMCEPGYHSYLVEFDIKSAYTSSLLNYKSFLWSMREGEVDDCGALENFKNLLPAIPKWIRLVLLGQVASHRMTFATMPNRKQGDYSMKWTTFEKVSYGRAFNQVHRAILRLYRCMQRIHSIGGSHIKRMHTDSFALSLDCPESIELGIFEYLDDVGLTTTVKAQGSSHFFDVNSGIIGRKFIGVPHVVREELKQLERKPVRRLITEEELNRWGWREVKRDENLSLLNRSGSIESGSENRHQPVSESREQLRLWA